MASNLLAESSESFWQRIASYELKKPNIVTLAVISDPHVFTGKSQNESPSWIGMEDDQSNPTVNPFTGVKQLIEDDGLSADLLFCGGDLGDKAVPQAQQYAWEQINQIGALLKVEQLLGAAGNHDVDSRFVHNNHDAKGQILALRPKYPTNNEQEWLEYWAQNYTTLNIRGIRFTLVNSSAFHGYQADGSSPEYLNGRITERTLDALKAELEQQGTQPVNLMLCHHHPAKNDIVPITDYSHMINGDRLLNMLDKVDVGPWLILHGHKHIPRVFYAPGGNSSPTIFSAGSFAAKQYPEIQDIARCEFYLLDLVVPDSMGFGAVKGKIRVWQWSYGNGWIRGKQGNGMGYEAAFGSRVDIDELSRETAEKLVKKHAGQRLKWADVVSLEPKIDYLIPSDAKTFERRLTERHDIQCLRDDTGALSEVQVPS